MNSIYFQSVHHFYLFLFSLGMLERWYVNLISNGNVWQSKPVSHYTIEWLLASIECEEFTNASYFKRVIEEHFYKENETYFRIVYLWAEGLLDSKQGRVKEGQKRWKMLSVFLRCLAVINLPNTIEIRPIVEYLQTKKII